MGSGARRPAGPLARPLARIAARDSEARLPCVAVRNALIRVFQMMAIIEAVTWTGLLISMVFKYG